MLSDVSGWGTQSAASNVAQSDVTLTKRWLAERLYPFPTLTTCLATRVCCDCYSSGWVELNLIECRYAVFLWYLSALLFNTWVHNVYSLVFSVREWRIRTFLFFFLFLPSLTAIYRQLFFCKLHYLSVRVGVWKETHSMWNALRCHFIG